MTNARRTQLLLRLVARRLSGRTDCKQVEFQIGIGDNNFEKAIVAAVDPAVQSRIFFWPAVSVYKDTHHRSDRDRSSVVDLILRKHFPDLIVDKDELGNLQVDTSKLVTGVYKYQKSYDGKRRRWVKVRTTLVQPF